jgi:hypothetical protein
MEVVNTPLILLNNSFQHTAYTTESHVHIPLNRMGLLKGCIDMLMSAKYCVFGPLDLH